VTINIWIDLTAENIIKLEGTIEKEKPRLFSFIRLNVPTREEAEDILQDVFYQFVSNVDSLQLMNRISSWLFHVAKNKIIDSKRKMKPSLTADMVKAADDRSTGETLSLEDIIPDFSSLPDEAYWRIQFWDEIEDALDDMPDKQREIFELTEYEGLTFRQIAGQKQEPISTLLSRKRSAILYLRKRLKNLYEDLYDV
jgi:RNA polymerase sigma factor (sigma-70 family)